MKTHIAIVVYNRFHNVKHWLECWEKCDKDDTEVVIIHNWDKRAPEYEELCKEHGALYIRRKNVGYDIGCFQELCRNRLKFFPNDWQRVLWMTDDTFPMAFDFVKQFNNAMKPGVGCACMYISPYVRRHIRTTGFMIDRETAGKLEFPADPITTKWECFLFEHKWKGNIFYDQVKRMGLDVVMVANNRTSPLWDSGYHRRIDRQKEHEEKFSHVNMEDRILFICPIYKSYPQIISSLLLQTHKNWILMLIHDGPDTTNVARFIPDDDRIQFMETPKHGGCWGHYIRQIGIEMFHGLSDYLIVTNPDNYYVPTALEFMLKGFGQKDSAVAVYSGQIIHSYTAWKVMECRLTKGFLDCGGVMFKSFVGGEVPWPEINDHSADWMWFEDIIKKYGVQRFHKVNACLFVHN